jgi:hypothetical protein
MPRVRQRSEAVDVDHGQVVGRGLKDVADAPHENPPEPAPVSLAAQYENLRAVDAKKPSDYYALALLADLVDRDRVGFVRWILAGLRRFPDEPALAQLLSVYLGTDEAAENAEWLMVATSQAVPSDHFYDVTRVFWDRLIGAVDFTLFRALLEACEANLDGDPGEGYVAFSWWVLRRAVWEPSPAWFNAKIADLESLGDLIRWDAVRDRDLVDHLIIYRRERQSIVTKAFVRTEMDRTVIACTTSSQDVGDRRMAEAQQTLAGRGHELLKEFPSGVKGVDALVIVWEHLSADAAARLGILSAPVEADQHARVREFALSLLTIGWRPLAWLWSYWGYGLQRLCKVIIAVVWAFLAISCGIGTVTVAMTVPAALIGILGMLAGVSFAFRWLWRLLDREQAETLSKAYRRLYRHVWRPRIIGFLRATPVPIGSLVNELLAIAEEPIGRRWQFRANRIAQCVSSDVGIRLWQTAIHFDRGPRA